MIEDKFSELEKELLKKGLRRKPTLDETETFLYEEDLVEVGALDETQELNFDY